MYSRFYRWASDRLGDEGIVAFVTNRSFIESRTFDGFRKLVAKDFQEIHIVDLGGDVRANPKLSGTTHNVFGIQTGVAIAFLVRRKVVSNCSIYYGRRPELETAEDKLSFLASATLTDATKHIVKPNDRADWLNTEDADGWHSMLPVGNASTKAGKEKSKERAIFKLYSLGVATNRDDWVYGFSPEDVQNKVTFLADKFNQSLSLENPDQFDDKTFKWTRSLKKRFLRKNIINVDKFKIIEANYRPFRKNFLYFDDTLNEMHNRTNEIFKINETNRSITFMGDSSGKPYFTLAIDRIPDLNFVSPASGGSQTLPRYRYTKSGERIDNITDWAFNKFVAHYGKKCMSKDAIFAYCYAVLHDPVYRETYALNLKREFPRIPFYPEFAQWASWGETLMAMHIGYDQVEPFALERIETASKRAKGTAPKPVLKSNPEAGCILIDADTQLTGIPTEAWNYRLGNRSAIDWVLDQHKEKKPRDPTIAAKFNTYRFANYKEACIDLLARVVTISIDTVKITDAMKALDRSEWN